MKKLLLITMLLGVGWGQDDCGAEYGDCPIGMTCIWHPISIAGNASEYGCVPDLFSDVEWSISVGYYYFFIVTINDEPVTSYDWVGAFNGEVCVGYQLWDTSQCASGVCDMALFGDIGEPETEGYMQAGDIPTFKIYDASQNAYYDAIPSESIPWYTGTFANADYLSAYADDCEEVYTAGLEDGILIGAQSGDVNGDGVLNVIDIVIFVEMVLNP